MSFGRTGIGGYFKTLGAEGYIFSPTQRTTGVSTARSSAFFRDLGVLVCRRAPICLPPRGIKGCLKGRALLIPATTRGGDLTEDARS